MRDSTQVLAPLRYDHVDVFSPRPYSGNSLAVFADAAELKPTQMALITREHPDLRVNLLVEPTEPLTYRARVFDVAGELDFAGHPLLGAACVLHARANASDSCRWTLRLRARSVTVETSARSPARFSAVLNQGAAQFLGTPRDDQRREIASWFSLDANDLDPALPPEVISTGLRYLILPVRGRALERARICRPDLDARLAALGAQFAYLFDAHDMEGRHWNNDGLLEDVATGSGAGCVAAYLRRRNRIGSGESATLRQGRFLGRPSEILLRAHGAGTDVHRVEVGGDVSIVGCGWLSTLPAN